jgi:hypothetical protein
MAWRRTCARSRRRSSARQGGYTRAYGSRHPGAAPVWHAQADSAACRLASTQAPGRSGVPALRGARIQGTGGQCRLDTLTRRLLVELNASGCANRTNLRTARRVGRRHRAGLPQPREAAARDRLHPVLRDSSRAAARTTTTHALVIPRKASARTRLRLAAASGRTEKPAAARSRRDRDERFLARAIVRAAIRRHARVPART